MVSNWLILSPFPKDGPPTLREVLFLATLKQRLHMKNSSGTYDVVHLETSASLITAGTLVAGVLAATGTDYTTYRIRNIAIVTSVPTSMSNGTIALVVK